MSWTKLTRWAGAWNNGRNRVITVDAPDRAGVKVPTQEELLAVFAQVEASQVAPYSEDISDAPLVENVPPPGQVTARDSIPELGVALWTLSNGVRVQLKSTDFKNDEILFSAHSPGSFTGGRCRLHRCSDRFFRRARGRLGSFNRIELERS